MEEVIHPHYFLIPSTEYLRSSTEVVIGVCACGVEKEHKPFWLGGDYETLRSSNREFEHKQAERLAVLGYQLV